MAFIDEQKIYKSILDNLNEGIRFVDTKMTVSYWNRSAELITGIRGVEVIGTRCGEAHSIHFGEQGLKLCGKSCPVLKTCSDGITREEKVFVKHVDGRLIPVIMCVTAIRGPEGDIQGAMEMFSDVSWKEAALKRIDELNRMALLDPLVGVGNRRFAEGTLRAKLQEMRRYGLSFGIMFIDVNGFKNINDCFGHNVGDMLLKSIARSLAGCMRMFDFVCRWGGDEFLVLVSNIQDEEQLRMLADRVCSILAETGIEAGGETLYAMVSVGATFARHTDTAESLVARADALMYESKASGICRVTLG